MKYYTYKLEKDQRYGEIYVVEYDNGIRNNFWCIDDLSGRGYDIESYKKAKEWLMRNHPELLI